MFYRVKFLKLNEKKAKQIYFVLNYNIIIIRLNLNHSVSMLLYYWYLVFQR